MLDKIKNSLKTRKVDAVLVSSHANITHLTGYSNFSKEEREAYLFITEDAQYLLTDGRYTEAVKKVVAHFELIEVSSTLSHKEALKNLAEKHGVVILGIEEDSLTVSEFKVIKKIAKKVKSFRVSEHRTIKTLDEIEKIERACDLADKTFEFILGKIKPGKTEKELAFEMENFMRQNGAVPSFETIVAFGPNAAIPHHHTGDDILGQENNLILMDFGCKVDNYCSDITRVVFLGKASIEQKKVYSIVNEAHNKAVEYLKSSKLPVDSQKVDEIARKYIDSKGFPPYSHGLGHGVGIEVHEFPRLSMKSKDKLLPGMVFSIEPGIYLPGQFGVRIEDLYVLEENGIRALTKSPKEIIQV
ncbi:MAG: Xaa-Pro aminopeptidase [Candidatus Daviesbacteria bacterium GW2011_GWA2_38_24]|uniref:Xaa-Pro aminopeptidase n=1 Tax=Candidatus Daviesbacteria bacterium GW2011_GWA2_38_24 TaxID=1618422 RepID=A0A0G0JTP3_9BACT|nr:MAG: Xaa-Pro aminopeptidase [Candidatus Daviesbacteria bacterium GW2011_GWA2_38_24]OGE23601.1 MAG: hypothetical protein A2688_04790 [Candidatus Daviesbacteria bacterium RIFCSPHIGHO2_01_FULL_38_8]